MRKSIKKDEYQSKAELYQGISTELEYILNNQQSFFKKINSLKSEIKKMNIKVKQNCTKKFQQNIMKVKIN